MKNILIIHDDAISLRTIGYWMGFIGAVPIPAQSIKDGINNPNAENSCFLILDFNLGSDTAVSAYRMYRERYGDRPYIICSGDKKNDIAPLFAEFSNQPLAIIRLPEIAQYTEKIKEFL